MSDVEAVPHRGRQQKEWMSRKEAAAFLETVGCPIAPSTLASMASNNNRGKGPPYTVISHRIVRYRQDDLRAWAGARSRRVG